MGQQQYGGFCSGVDAVDATEFQVPEGEIDDDMGITNVFAKMSLDNGAKYTADPVHDSLAVVDRAAPQHAIGANVYYHVPGVGYDEHGRAFRTSDGLGCVSKSMKDMLGIYHVGLEVQCIEYCFGNRRGQKLPELQTTALQGGVYRHVPKRAGPSFQFKQQVCLGFTRAQHSEIEEVAIALGKAEYASGTYSLVHHNCANFVSTLSNLIGGDDLPDWCRRGADLAKMLGIAGSRSAPTPTYHEEYQACTLYKLEPSPVPTTACSSFASLSSLSSWSQEERGTVKDVSVALAAAVDQPMQAQGGEWSWQAFPHGFRNSPLTCVMFVSAVSVNALKVGCAVAQMTLRRACARYGYQLAEFLPVQLAPAFQTSVLKLLCTAPVSAPKTDPVDFTMAHGGFFHLPEDMQNEKEEAEVRSKIKAEIGAIASEYVEVALKELDLSMECSEDGLGSPQDRRFSSPLPAKTPSVLMSPLVRTRSRERLRSKSCDILLPQQNRIDTPGRMRRDALKKDVRQIVRARGLGEAGPLLESIPPPPLWGHCVGQISRISICRIGRLQHMRWALLSTSLDQAAAVAKQMRWALTWSCLDPQSGFGRAVLLSSHGFPATQRWLFPVADVLCY